MVSLADDDGETEKLVTDCGRRYAYLHADITARGVPAEVVDQCVADLGGIDILVNSAGICLLADVEEFDRAEWDPMVAVNLTAAFELSRAASREMVRQGSGKIINIASLFSFLGGRQSPAYAATKAGIVGFTKAYCDELGRAQHPGQRHRPRLLRHRDHHRHAGRTPSRTAGWSNTSLPAAGETRPT